MVVALLVMPRAACTQVCVASHGTLCLVSCPQPLPPLRRCREADRHAAHARGITWSYHVIHVVIPHSPTLTTVSPDYLHKMRSEHHDSCTACYLWRHVRVCICASVDACTCVCISGVKKTWVQGQQTPSPHGSQPMLCTAKASRNSALAGIMASTLTLHCCLNGKITTHQEVFDSSGGGA